MKTGARMRTAKIMVSTAFTNSGKLETGNGFAHNARGLIVAMVPVQKPIGA